MIITTSTSPRKRPKAPWYTNECHLAKQETYQALILLNTAYNPENRVKYINAKKSMHFLFAVAKKQYLAQWAEKLSMAKTSHSFWELIGRLSTPMNVQPSAICLKDWATFYTAFYKTPPKPTPAVQTDRAFQRYLAKLSTKFSQPTRTSPTSNVTSPAISEQEIRLALNKLKLGKAPGKDLLTPDCFKSPPPSSSVPYLFYLTKHL